MDPSSSSSSNKRIRDLDCYDEPRYKRPKYDVFVNYASEEIGNSFVSHLKGALVREGFTICDHTMLPLGQDQSSELLKAIDESEIYLVLISPKYPFYKECLDVLVRIMESLQKFKKRKVFPIFFNVDPSDVRNQQGPFLEAFLYHEKNVDPVGVQIWRKSLKEAGDKSGLNLKDWRDEEQLIRKIMKDVRKMQNPQQLCYVEHPVGIDSRAQDVISALKLTDQACSIVAVFGISGSGKTTIVKAVYDKIAADFDVSCFIENIHGLYTGPNWEVKLQRDAIYRLTAGKNKFKGSDGVAKLIKLLSGQKVLLILDDVYEFKQLQALSIHLASFHDGSRIIVTTRNKLSLSNLPHTPYNIRLLNKIESFELFTRVIGKGDPIDKKFVKEIVECAGGIPLVLEVWSRHFTDNDRNRWPRMLETLKRIPLEDTQKKLRISYDSLPKRAQNLFLDIACFFEGMYKDLVIQVLQDEDFFPDVEIQIQNLVHKFLVDGDEQLLLHDVIREMGQEVVRQENEVEPGKRTRLMGYRDVIRVLGDCSGTDSVRSIQLYGSDKEERVTVQLEAIRKMGNLRFIHLSYSKLQWSSSSNDDDMSACFSFKHLKYLDWNNFPCKSLDNFDMGNVVVIILHHSKLEKLSEGVKNLKKLKILDVFWSYSLTKTGNFTGLENLEQLNLYECFNLEELDSSIGCLQKLVDLNLHGCTRLKSLPWEMIGKLTSLQYLNLRYCPNILEISHEVGSLISLKHLDLSRNRFNNLPNSLCQLHQLTILQLSDCTNLKSIPDLPLNIEYVDANYCENLVNLPSNCSELQFLTELKLCNCSTLGSEGFTQVTGLRNLQKLGMQNCNISQVSSGIGNLVSLERLHLSGNTFSSLPESFSNLSKLEKLVIQNCSQLQLLPPLPSQLTYIDATYCTSLNVMPYDSMQKAYIFPSKVFKELLTSTKQFFICLPLEELPEWCTYLNSGNNVLSFVAPIQFDHRKICGLIICATRDNKNSVTFSTVIYNKTKGTSHKLGVEYIYEDWVMFCPLNDTTLVVEAGDTVEVVIDNKPGLKSCGLRLVYEDEVVDSGLVLKDVRKPTLSLFPLSSESDIMTGNNDDDDDDDDIVMSGELRLVYEDDVVDSGLVLKDVRKPTLSLFPLSSESEIMTGNSITELNDEDVCSFPIQNEEYTYYDFFPMVS